MKILESLVTVTAVAILAAAAATARAQPAPSAALDDLAHRAASAGSVRVIVHLNVPVRPEGLLPADDVSRQRGAIRAAQNEVASRALSGTSSRAHTLFDTIPFLAAEVDANGMARLRASTLVRDIQEDHVATPTLAQSAPLVNAPTAWNRGYNGAGWAVAVLDTGVDKTHPFLAGRVVSEACYSTTNTQAQSLCPGGVSSSTATDSAMPCATYCDHGTHVAGIAAGGPRASDNSYGVAAAGNLIAVQVFSLFPNYYGPGQGAVLSYSSDQIKGLERVYALRGTYPIASVNMSLGGGRYTSTCDASYSGTKAAIDNLRSVGIATVIAAGNNGYTDSISGPGCISTAVSVGATCDAYSSSTCALGVNGIASYSNIAGFVSLLAPGSFIVSSVPGGGYASYSGTSMATPHVAGAWAVLKHWLPGASVADALDRFRANGLAVDDLRSGGTVTGMKRIDVAFVGANPAGYALSVSRTGSGAGTVGSAPAGISCGSDCTETYAAGTSVTLTATPSAGSSFTGWSGACTGTGTCTVAMTADRTVTANFAGPATLTLTRSGTAAALGSVVSSPAGIDCGADCSESYPGGTSVSLTASAPAGAGFAGWSGGCTGTAPTCVLTLTASTTVDARFEIQYPLSVTVSRSTSAADGSVSSSPAGISCGADCTESYNGGTSVKLTARAASGSKFAGWSGACSGTKTSCTVTMTTARSVTATFKR